ncbi:MAG: hypothetical protein L0H41_00690 [Microlunatus sp.]|nr:hypothetical protein [Microlunatus sp.]MDN5769814.1 hypothetical protein [Microlunatus sp.]MDN5804341.1 hypothetical protein [Microlunatus sp.]
MPYFDDQAGEAMGAVMDREFDLLLGRRTYDIFASFWPAASAEKPVEWELRASSGGAEAAVSSHSLGTASPDDVPGVTAR